MKITKVLSPLSLRLGLPVLMVLGWQILAVHLNRPTVLPRLNAVVAVLLHPCTRLMITGSLLENTAISLTRVFLGFLLAALVGVPLGMWMGYSHKAEQLFDSTLEVLRPIPPLAWVPLILAWFGIKGIGDWFPWLSGLVVVSGLQFATIIIIFIGALFPILVSTIQGVKNIPAEYIESARTLGARRFFLLCKILIPASLPSILTGLRIGLGIGWMCLVAAEMMPGSSAGLGYLIWYAYELLRTDIIVAGMIVIGIIGFLMDRGFRLLERSMTWSGKMKQPGTQ